MSAARLSYCRLAGVQQCPALASSVPPFDGGGIMGSVGMCVRGARDRLFFSRGLISSGFMKFVNNSFNVREHHEHS